MITTHQEENSDQLRNAEKEWDCTFIQNIYYHSVKNTILGSSCFNKIQKKFNVNIHYYVT